MLVDIQESLFYIVAVLFILSIVFCFYMFCGENFDLNIIFSQINNIASRLL